jgi:hypothetical protein
MDAVTVKTCSACKESLPVELFHSNRAQKDGYARQCKECFKAYSREHYKKNKGAYLERNRTQRRRNRQKVMELKDRPCTDCGGTFPPIVMEFDHREPETKEFSIGRGPFAWLKKVQAELEKCDLVCANCHKLRTHTRRQLTAPV